MSASPVAIRAPGELALMREAGRIVCEILDELEALCVPGATTFDVDRRAEELIARHKAKPAFKGYGPKDSPFPAVLCISLNEEVVHGIPSRKRVIAAGDLVKLDFGVSYRGWFGDSARTVEVGQVSPAAARLARVTRECLARAIAAAVPGNHLGDVSHAIQAHAEAAGYSAVRDFVGHGIGRRLHEQPQIPNFGSPGAGLTLRPGMALAVEPMVNAGTWKVEILEDDWTAVTLDHQLSAHAEHTIVVADGPAEVLTRRR